eukprot:2674733-Rhodomonas_salina.2
MVQTCRLSVEFQWFLMALSVRPGRSLAISAHLFCSRLQRQDRERTAISERAAERRKERRKRQGDEEERR